MALRNIHENMAKVVAYEYWVEGEERPSETFDRLIRGAEGLHGGRSYHLVIDFDPNEGRVRFRLDDRSSEPD